MELILWRHADAFELKDGENDFDRPLTPKGERQAQRMAQWLNQRLAHSTRILASPAVRSQQTAKTLGRKFRTLTWSTSSPAKPWRSGWHDSSRPRT